MEKRLSAEIKAQVRVRPATKYDLVDLLVFADQYARECGNKIPNYDLDHTKSSIQAYLDKQQIIIGEIEGYPMGAMAGSIHECLFTKEAIFASMFFYVPKSLRRFTREFLKEVEISFLPSKVTRLVIGIPGFEDHNRLARFMGIMGYQTLETHFYKKV